MSHLYRFATGLWLVVALCVVAAAGASHASAQSSDPEAVIRALHTAAQAKDVAGAVALFSDDATVTLIPPPPGTNGVFSGKEALTGFYTGLAAQNFASELSDFQVNGNQVRWKAALSMDDWRKLGIAPLEFTYEGVVENGKIKSFTGTMTPESLAKLQAALAQLPTTGGEFRVGRLWLLSLVGLTLTLGGALALMRARRQA